MIMMELRDVIRDIVGAYRVQFLILPENCSGAEASGLDVLPLELLDAAVEYYTRWEKGFDRRAWGQNMKMGGDGKGGQTCGNRDEHHDCRE